MRRASNFWTTGAVLTLHWWPLRDQLHRRRVARGDADALSLERETRVPTRSHETGCIAHEAEELTMEVWLRLPDRARAEVVEGYARRRPRLSTLVV